MGCIDCYRTKVCDSCANAELQIACQEQFVQEEPRSLERLVNISSGEDAFMGDVYVSEELIQG